MQYSDRVTEDGVFGNLSEALDGRLRGVKSDLVHQMISPDDSQVFCDEPESCDILRRKQNADGVKDLSWTVIHGWHFWHSGPLRCGEVWKTKLLIRQWNTASLAAVSLWGKKSG